jgi:hypothetical protein
MKSATWTRWAIRAAIPLVVVGMVVEGPLGIIARIVAWVLLAVLCVRYLSATGRS